MPLRDVNFADIVTFSRGTAKNLFSSASVLTALANNAPGIDFNPTTGAPRGFSIEPQRTNGIRNPRSEGAVSGTPGTDATNWGRFTALTGLTSTLIGAGTEDGIEYSEYRISGTPSGAGTYDIFCETATAIAALSGQTWTPAQYMRLTGGSWSGVSSLVYRVNEYSSGGVFVTGQSTTALNNPTSAALKTQRQEKTVTLVGGGTVVTVLPFLRINLTGAAVDFTIRIGVPTMEQGSFVTSPIRPPAGTLAASTRAADAAAVNLLSPWFNSSEGTLYAEIEQTIEDTSAQVAWEFNDDTFNNRIYVAIDTPSPGNRRVTSNMWSGGVQQAQMFSAAVGSAFKTAFAWKANDLAASQNGSAVQTDASATIPSVSKLYLGSRTGSGYMTGWLRKVIFYPPRKTNAELPTITA